MPLSQSVPVLRLRRRSITSGTRNRLVPQRPRVCADPFPATPPYEFAILRQAGAEIMLRRGQVPERGPRRHYDWDVYLRREGPRDFGRSMPLSNKPE